MLIDLRNKGLTGKEAEEILDKAGITVNKNSIPFDPQKPNITSGIRVGTAAVTTRGMGVEEMKQIAAFIDDALTARDDSARLEEISRKVRDFAGSFPVHRSVLGYDE
jgi:glycine hydroxymethyltransferase